MDTRDDLLLLMHKFILMNHNSHSINTRWHMLYRYIILLKGLQNLTAETDLRVHHCLCNKYGAEILLACNTSNNIILLAGSALYNPGPLISRGICIPDINRYTALSYRENRILMKYRSSHIGQLSQFPIGDILYRLRIINNPWVSYQKARYIGPVFIDVCLGSLGHN